MTGTTDWEKLYWHKLEESNNLLGRCTRMQEDIEKLRAALKERPDADLKTKNGNLQRSLRQSEVRESDLRTELDETQTRLNHALAQVNQPQSIEDVVHGGSR